MEDRLYYSDGLKFFLDKLGDESPNMDACDAKVSEALRIISGDIGLGSVDLCIDAPPTRFRPNGEYRSTSLYRCEGEVSSDAYTISREMPDGGTVTFTIRSCADKGFSDTDTERLELLFREIFYKYSRVSATDIIMSILTMDMPTTVLNQDGFMRAAAMMVGAGQISRYNILFFNIHNFKYVNKVFPYQEGDIVLKNYACKVKSYLCEDEIVARLGGDNFVALIRNDRVNEMIDRLQNLKIFHSAKSTEKEFILGATIGVSSLDNINNPRDIMGRASIAYQTARMRGVGSVCFYSDEIMHKVMENQSIVSNFEPALQAEEFVVYYQPKVDVNTNRVCGAEALIRWLRDGRLIFPNDFIPQLEREGSICRLDYYVLEQTCKFIRQRLDQGKEVMCISVNFSRRHMDEDNLVEKIVSTIDRYGIDHRYIEVELTESEDFQNYERMSEIVEGLKAYGIGTSIDDFGTGFSSLNMIKEVDLNIIKIDKSFIPLDVEYPNRERDRVMFCSIIDMVKKLGKKIIAEGVETPEQLNYLRTVGCDIVQGYVYDKPLPREDFEERIEKGYSKI